MASFLLKRVALVLPTLLLVVTLTFVAVRMLPGDPAQIALGDYATVSAVKTLRHEMGLDQPLPLQYLSYLAGLARGDLGTSVSTGRPVTEQLVRLGPDTLALALTGTVIGLSIGLVTGIASAVFRDSLLDHAFRLIALIGVAMPIFYLGLLLLVVFGLDLRWFPVLGAGSWKDPPSILAHLVLPGFVVGLNVCPIVMRITRSSMLSEMTQDFVRTARAKGLRERQVILRHALRNALIPILTVVALQAGNLLGGSVITEVVFSRPGIGKLLVDSVLSRDYPQVQGGVIVFAVAFIVVNLWTDILYGWIDPRVRSNG